MFPFAGQFRYVHTVDADGGQVRLAVTVLNVLSGLVLHQYIQRLGFALDRVDKLNGPKTDDAAKGKTVAAGAVSLQQLMVAVHFNTGPVVLLNHVDFSAFMGAVKKQGECVMCKSVAEVQGHDVGLPVDGKPQPAYLAALNNAEYFPDAGDGPVLPPHTRLVLALAAAR